MKNKKKIRQSEIDSIEDCKRRLRLCLARGAWKDAAEIHNQLGNSYRLLGQFEDALEEHNNEVNICKKHNKTDKMGLGIAYRNIGEVYIDMKKEDEAIPYIKQYLKLAQELQNFVEEQRALITLARTYLFKADNDDAEDSIGSREHNLDLAEKYFKDAYKLITESSLKEQLNNEKELMTMKCNNCQNLGLTFETKGNFTEAAMWLKKAVAIGRKFALHEYLHPCCNVLCSIYLKTNQTQEALSAIKDALLSAKAQGSLSMEVESRILEAKTFFCINEIETGKKILKKLRKKISGKDSCSIFMEELDGLLVSAIKLCRRLDALITVNPDEYDVLMKLHEEIGDNYSNLTVFSEAVKHYLKSVEFAEAHGIRGKKLTRLYFSIAETYKDQKDYKNALKYFEKEMELHEGNPVEKFRTQTSITIVMEKAGTNPGEIVEAHHLAIKLAVDCNSVKKEATAYQNLGLYLKSIRRLEESENMLRKVEKIKNVHKLSDLEEPETDSQDDLLGSDEVDLDNLSTDGESDEDENSEEKRYEVRGKRKISQRKNEAGETPLHLAAKRGDLNAVRKLIKQGHEINVGDTAGWTPLHEAANYGHAAVIAELIKHGARVNDRGGHLCEGIMPLHDAAGNGHFDVIELLLQNGANVLSMDDNKNLPIDHLIIWRHTNGQDIEMETHEEYKRIKRLIREKMSQKGRSYSKQDEQKAAKRGKGRCSSPKFSLLKSKGGEEDSLIPVKITGDNYDPDDANSATELYRSTIQGLARHNERRPRKKIKNEQPISPGPRNALIPSHLDVHEDWMCEDGSQFPELQQQTRPPKTSKRKRRTMDDLDLHETDSLTSTASSSHSTIRQQCDERPISPTFNTSPVPSPQSDVQEDLSTWICDESEDESNSPVFLPQQLKQTRLKTTATSKRKRGTMDEFIYKETTSHNTNTASTSSTRQFIDQPPELIPKKSGEVLRLKVRVLEHTLLVPVDEEHLNQTVEWLCEECSSRYLRAYGVKPILSLSTKDGAQLYSSDPISLVLGGTDVELVADVTSYDLPPLAQRFRNSCGEFKLEIDPDIISAMNMCQSSNILNLTDFNMKGNYAKAMFQSLQRHHSLRELILSGCSLYDDGIKEFCKVICTLPGLLVLDLSSNGITFSGFQDLVETLTKAKNAERFSNGPISLTSLTLSHNPLGNRASTALAEIISILPHLKHIAMADCNFTEKLFLTGRTELMNSFSKSRLEELDLSYNNWTEIGVEKLLQGLSPSRLRSLNFSSPGVKEDEETFSRIVANFMSKNEDCCNLKDLKLSDCGLTDAALQNIVEQFTRLVSLDSLDLSNNEFITAVSVEEILTQCQIHQIPLTRLDVGCCPGLWQNKPIAPERILLALERKLQTERKMKYLRVTTDGIPNYDNFESTLSKLESRIGNLWNEYAGAANSLHVKEGGCTIFEYE